MRRPPCAALATAALSLTLLVPAGTASAEPGDEPTAATSPTAPTAPTAPTTPGGLPDAEDALSEVETFFADGVGGATEEPGPDGVDEGEGRDVTLALRDLALTRDELTGAERRAAASYLARPTDASGAPYGVDYSVDEAAASCGDDVCVHRVASSGDAATAAYATRVLQTVQGVHETYVGAGYREPKSDRAAAQNGGSAKTDVYLADIGDQGIYGYCTSDQPAGANVSDVWAYCVLDNDYARGQYPNLTPLENMQVTAAHEYFHAVQFAYDVREDAWLMEGTATWAEDELFDAVDDNVSYLDRGPMGRPTRSLDLDKGGLEVYGAWSLWRYLSEQLPAAEGGMPTLVRRVWEKADSVEGRDLYSLKALRATLKERGTTMRARFADYVAANRFPAERYEEGASYPQAPLAARRELTRASRTTSYGRRLNHLAGATVRLTPGAGLKAKKWSLRLAVDLPARKRGSALRVSTVLTDGTTATENISLRRDGDATVRVPFSSAQVEAIEVHLVNASTRINQCSSGGAVSCSGFARDDRQPVRLAAKVVGS